MDGFLGEILSLPTGIYTVLLTVATTYWLAVILGGLDIDILGGGPIDGIDGAADALDGGADGDLDVGDGGFLGLLSTVGLRGVPLTFSLSVLILWSWALCWLGMHYLAPIAPAALPVWLVSLVIFAVSFLVGVLGASVSVRPFQRVFKTHQAPPKLAFIGRPCTITTATVDAKFGQALCEDGGAGLVISVRYEGKATLTKGRRALLVDYDPARDVFTVEPLEAMGDEPPVPNAGPPEPERRDFGPREPVS